MNEQPLNTGRLWEAVKTKGPGQTLLAIAVGWFLVVGARMMYPVLLPQLRTVYSLNLTIAGFLLTVLWLAFAFGQFPGGILADKIGEGTTMLMSLLLSAVILTLLITARTPFVLFAATALFGFGTALYSVARLSALPDLFPDKLGTAVGLVAGSSDAGRAILPPVAGLLALWGSWQFGFGFAIPLFLFAALGIWLIVPKRTADNSNAVDDVSMASVWYIVSGLNNREVMFGAGIMVLVFAIWTSFTGFFPSYLTEVKGISSSVTSGLFGLFFVMGIGLKPLSGAAYDRYGIRRSLLAILVVSGLAMSLLPTVEGARMLLVVTVLVSPLSSCSAIVQSFLLEVLPEDMQGTGLGLIRFGFITLGALGPVVFGAVADIGYFREGFYGLAGVVGVIILAVLLMPNSARMGGSSRIDT